MVLGGALTRGQRTDSWQGVDCSLRTAAGAAEANRVLDETWWSAFRTHLRRICAAVSLHSASANVIKSTFLT